MSGYRAIVQLVSFRCNCKSSGESPSHFARHSYVSFIRAVGSDTTTTTRRAPKSHVPLSRGRWLWWRCTRKKPRKIPSNSFFSFLIQFFICCQLKKMFVSYLKSCRFLVLFLAQKGELIITRWATANYLRSAQEPVQQFSTYCNITSSSIVFSFLKN